MRETVTLPATKVTIVGLNYAPEPTGIAPYTTGLARGLQERGFVVDVVTAFPHYPAWRAADHRRGRRLTEVVDGVSLKRIPHYIPSAPTNARRGLSEVTFGIGAVLTRWSKPDVVISPSPALLASAVVQLRARLGSRRPAFGVIVQDLYSAGLAEIATGGSLTVRALTSLERRVLQDANGVSTIHDRMRSRIVTDLGVDPARVRVIRNWTHVPPPAHDVPRDAIRDRMGWRPDELIVLHTGAMGEKQALQNVVDTARLVDKRDLRIRFVLMGDGGQRRSLQDRAAGVSAVRFADPVPTAFYSGVLAAADLLLVNERVGVADMALPSKLTSYFRSGRPVIAATGEDSTTAAELTASGAGVVVAPGDPEALLRVVRSFQGDTQRASELGARGPVYCEDVLSEKASLDAYANWVHDLAARRRR